MKHGWSTIQFRLKKYTEGSFKNRNLLRRKNGYNEDYFLHLLYQGKITCKSGSFKFHKQKYRDPPGPTFINRPKVNFEMKRFNLAQEIFSVVQIAEPLNTESQNKYLENSCKLVPVFLLFCDTTPGIKTKILFT